MGCLYQHIIYQLAIGKDALLSSSALEGKAFVVLNGK